MHTSCYTQQGARWAIYKNIQDALNEAYYDQLEDNLMGYKQVTITKYFKNLDSTRCKMDTEEVKEMTATL